MEIKAKQISKRSVREQFGWFYSVYFQSKILIIIPLFQSFQSWKWPMWRIQKKKKIQNISFVENP